MDTSRPSRPLHYAATQNSPLKIKTTSVPTEGKIFKVEEVNQDLVVELIGATIDEDPLTASSHYILDQCNKLAPSIMTHIPRASLPLAIPPLKHGNEYLYRSGRWVASKIPKMLRAVVSSNRSRSTRRETIRRPVPGTSQQEAIEGTFLPAAGSEEQQIANWLNTITDALQDFFPRSTNTTVPVVAGKMTTHSMATLGVAKHRLWSSDTSCRPVNGDMSWKPDLVLQEFPPLTIGPQQALSWVDVISFIEVSSKPYSYSDGHKTVHSAVMRKAYAIFASQPSRRFLFAMSIADQKFRAHMFDCSGVVHSRPYNLHKSPRALISMLGLLGLGISEQIGYDPTLTYFPSIPSHLSNSRLNTIKVKSQTYDIIDRIFFNFLIRGRGTSSWHVCLGKTHYVVKDSWTHMSRLSREEDILRKIRGLKGVPRLVTAWSVRIGNSDDRTDTRRPSSSSNEVRVHRRLVMQPVARPLSDFRSIRELLSVVIDILDSASGPASYFTSSNVLCSSQKSRRTVSRSPPRC